MTRSLIVRSARAVLSWLLGRQPATRPRRAVAWGAAVVACALAVEGGLLGALLAAAWWLLAQLAALLWHAGLPLLVAVAALAGARRGIRRASPGGPRPDPAVPTTGLPGSSDTDPADPEVAAPAPEAGSSDTERHLPDRPADGQTRPAGDVAPPAEPAVCAAPDRDGQASREAGSPDDPLTGRQPRAEKAVSQPADSKRGRRCPKLELEMLSVSARRRRRAQALAR
jgi:hypothetical protein